MVSYFVKSNYTFTYRVEIKGKEVSIYKQKNDTDEEFSKLVKKYNTEHVFIGKIPYFTRKPVQNWFAKIFFEEEESVQLSESYRKKFEGNTILLKISKTKYVEITNFTISSFTIEKDEIIDYISPIERNNTAYPIATGVEYFYYMFDNFKIRKDKVPEDIQKNPYSMIDYFYRNKDIQEPSYKKFDLVDSR